MKMKTLSLIGAALMFTGLGAMLMSSPYSAAQDSVHTDKHAHAHAGYIKPGAAIDLMHDYDGQTRIGELETVTLSLHHIYTQGRLSLTLLAPDGLNLSQSVPVMYIDIYDSAPITLPVQFSSAASGQYNLGVEVVYDSPDGDQSRRMLAVPILIGDARTSVKAHAISEALPSPKSKGGVIALPAQEVIH